MLVNSIDAALEDAEKAFNRIGTGFAPHIFTGTMAYHFMFGELRANKSVLPGIIGHKVRLICNLLFEDGFQGFGGYIGDMERSDIAITLNQRENSVFMGVATALLCAGLGSDKGFIGFNRAVIPQHPIVFGFHCLADSMGHKPSSFIGHAQRAV